ncbi:MAG: tetratricopeptide repeat protein [Candidatus Protochlamydia sp.]|nr:tetratricopeptide repeat protein [Candidatus Protochlamydia sp.]
MPDPYLDALMRGEYYKKKETLKRDKFELALEKEIAAHIESLHFESNSNQYKTTEMQKTQKREEMQAGLEMPELENNISLAFSTLLSTGSAYLSPDLNEEMVSELTSIKLKLDVLNLDQSLPNGTFQELFNVTDSVMNGILKIGVEKFHEKELKTSIALFTFLTTLNPGNVDYLYRLGMAAQMNENFDLALKAFSAVLELNPQLLGAWLFACECSLHTGDQAQASAYFKQAKELTKDRVLNESWKKLISNLEARITL